MEFLSGRCDQAVEEEVRRRIEGEADFRRLHENLSRVVASVRLLDEVDPPGDLAERVVARVRGARREAAMPPAEPMPAAGARSTFSLWELGALAAATIVMAVIFIPSIRQANRQTQVSQCKANVGQIGTALVKYANFNKSFLPAADGSDLQWLGGTGRTHTSNSAELFKLVRGAYARPEIFQCPAVQAEKTAADTRSDVALRPDMTDFPAARFISFSYQHALGPAPISPRDPAMKAVAETMAILADSTPVFRDGRFLRDRVGALTSDNHARTGQNVLYLDTHVEWRDKALAGVEQNNIFLVEGIFDYSGNETPRSPTDTFLLPAFSK